MSITGTLCFSKAGLAEGTNANTIKLAAPNGAGVDYLIDGLFYHKADTDNIALTVCAPQADLTTCLYLVQLNTNGDVSIVKGTDHPTHKLADGGSGSLAWPKPTVGCCPIGAFKVVNVGGTFTTGTTDLGAATVTDTYYDFPAIPGYQLAT
jgi:hypothetical protein